MNTIEILQALPALFRSADILKYTGNANVFLTRALERGYITRLTRGVYVNSRMKSAPSLEEAACFVRTPSYISDRLYSGFKKEEGYNLATPEKALLDCVYYRNFVPFADELEREELDLEILQNMAFSFPVRVQKMVAAYF